MRNKYYLLAAIAVCCSCQGTIETISEQGHPTDTPSGVFFSAELENDDTKVVLQNDGSKVYFAPGDEILVIQGNKSGRFVSTLQSPGTRSDFSGETVFDEDGEPFWALYPYSTNYKLSKSGITITLPEKQKASKGSVDSSAFCMIARSNTHKLSFKNVCGGIKFSVATDSVSMVQFRGNNNERIAGKASVSLDENGIPECVSSDIYSTTITIVPSDSNYFEKGVWYYCAVFPVELSRGYTLSFFKEDNDNKATIETGVFECSNPVSIKRSVWGRIGDADDSVEYGLEAGNGYLLYRTTDNQIINSLQWYGYQSSSYDGEKYLNFGDFSTSSLSYYDADSNYFVIDESEMYNYPWRSLRPNYSLWDRTRVKEIVMAQSTLHPACYYYTNLERVTLSNDRRTIFDRAFQGCSSLKEIKMPARLSSIYYGAFMYCSSLASITIPRGVSSIKKDAFYLCSGLTEVQISDLSSWLKISFDNQYSNPLFYGGNLLLNGYLIEDLNVPDDISAIKPYTFINCKSIKSVTIPEGVTTIGELAFSGCTNLTSITIPEGVTTIGDYAFSGCSNLLEITLPKSLTTIGELAFSGCTNLTSITIPEGVTTIGSYPFSNCEKIKKINIGSSAAINLWKNLFYNKQSIEEVVILNGIESIPEKLFEGYSGIVSVTIPETVNSIGPHAFDGCRQLSQVHICDLSSWLKISFDDASSNPLSYGGNLLLNGNIIEDLSVPDDISIIKPYTFFGCNSIKRVTIPEGVTEIGYHAFSACSNLTSINIPEGVTTIERFTFQRCESLTDVTIPNSVTSIGSCAFEYCTSLAEITIPSSVTSIGSEAFDDCYNLHRITISDGVTTIGAYAFSDCNSLTDITLPKSLTSIGAHAFEQTHITSISIPEGVTRINESTFSYCGYLSKVEFLGRITDIGPSAFWQCNSFTSFSIPEGVTTIGNYAFSRCSNLTSISIPDGVTTIGFGTFSGCSRLTSISIPDVVTTIDGNAFKGCSSLTSISIPVGVTTIGDYAFSECSSLTSISIPDGVTTIGDYTFKGCSSLTSISIPEGVTTIGDYAFSECSSLTSIRIPDRVTTIGDCAFNTCSSLSSAVVDAITPPSLGVAAFSRTKYNFKIYVPTESVDTYKNTDRWKDYIIYSK